MALEGQASLLQICFLHQFSIMLRTNINKAIPQRDRRSSQSQSPIQGSGGHTQQYLLVFSSLLSSFRGQQDNKTQYNLHSLAEGVMVDEGNDYVRSVDTPPKGHLQLYYKVWLTKECHLRVAHILKHSCKIILKNPIELSRKPTVLSG